MYAVQISWCPIFTREGTRLEHTKHGHTRGKISRCSYALVRIGFKANICIYIYIGSHDDDEDDGRRGRRCSALTAYRLTEEGKVSRGLAVVAAYMVVVHI